MFLLWITMTVVLLTPLICIICQRFFHQLSSFPGPFLVTIINFWRIYHELRGDTPQMLHKYHIKYGPVLRIAPNELVFSTTDVIDVAYGQGGRDFLNSQFYDGFTATKPNVFGTRDEDLHTIRRRQVAHGFSHTSFMRMEYIFDKHVQRLIQKLNKYVDTPKICDLKLSRQKGKYLVHFGAGHRMCIGRNPALVMLWKATVDLLRRFELHLPRQQDVDEEMVVCGRGFAELGNALDVKVVKGPISNDFA